MPSPAPSKPIFGTLVLGAGRPRISAFTGMPESTSIWSLCTPSSRSFSIPLAAGSTSWKTASMVGFSDSSDISCSSGLFQLAQRDDFRLADLAQAMGRLAFFHFPDRDERDQARGAHIQQQEEGEQADRDR